MPAGGVVQPDGRPPKAKGVGKTARRHDWEAPATPGVGNSDMQHGDRQRLEQAQQAAPRAKKQAASGRTGGQRRTQRQPQRNAQMQVPDPIEMAAERGGGKPFAPASGEKMEIDPTPWLPLMEQMANAPNMGGSLTAMMLEQFSNMRRRPLATQPRLIDLNEIDDILEG